jgi:flavodoxin short chain
MKVSIIYWSGTGNTETMAKAIKTGAESANAAVILLSVDKAGESDVLNADVVLFGCPSMGDETLEETEFEPFIVSVGKKIGLFGSYGWGDGQWMRDWTQRMTNAGANLVVESLIVNETPSEKDLEQCREFGKNAAKI